MAALRAANEFRRRRTAEAIGSLTLCAGGGALMALGQWSGQPLAQVSGAFVEAAGWTMGGAALMRLAFADEHGGEKAFRPGRQGLQWTAQEWRFLAAAVLRSIAVIAAFAIPYLLALAAAIAFGHAGSTSPAAVIALGLGVLAAIVAVIYVAARLSLARAASVSSQRITMGWGVTKGQVWPILGAFLLLSLGIVALVAAVFLLAAGLEAVAGVFGSGPEAESRAQATSTLVSALVVAYLQLPLSVGLEAYLYRGLRRPAVQEVATAAA
jgi:hypothetical protein